MDGDSWNVGGALDFIEVRCYAKIWCCTRSDAPIEPPITRAQICGEGSIMLPMKSIDNHVCEATVRLYAVGF